MERRFSLPSWLYYLVVLVVWGSYLYLTLHGSSVQSKQIWDLDGFKLLLIRLSVAVPYLVTWLVGVFGVSQLGRYVRTLTHEPERTGWWQISGGISALLIGLILSVTLGAIRGYVAFNLDLLKVVTIVVNYVYTFFPLVGFGLIFVGVRKLRKGYLLANSWENIYLTTFIVLILGTLNVFLIFSNPARQVSDLPGIQPTYFLSDLLIILTLIIPQLVTWWLGIFTALSSSEVVFANKMSLPIIRRLTSGLWFIIFSSFLLMTLLSLGGRRLVSLGLGTLLLLIYVLLLLQAAGYIFVALAGQKLYSSKIVTS